MARPRSYKKRTLSKKRKSRRVRLNKRIKIVGGQFTKDSEI